jgi:hypothetical protein
MLVEITVASLKAAAEKLPVPTKETPLSAIDEGIRVSAANNAGGRVTVSDVTAKRVDELLGVKPVSAETGTPAGETPPVASESKAVASESAAAEDDADESDAEGDDGDA